MKKPQCLVEEPTSIGHSPLGYITPCCYTSVNNPEKHEGISQLYAEHLKISNVDSIEEIIFSDEWLEFFDMLKNRPAAWPRICIKICTERNS